jgi:hypothetical protein
MMIAHLKNLNDHLYRVVIANYVRKLLKKLLPHGC